MPTTDPTEDADENEEERANIPDEVDADEDDADEDVGVESFLPSAEEDDEDEAEERLNKKIKRMQEKSFELRKAAEGTDALEDGEENEEEIESRGQIGRRKEMPDMNRSMQEQPFQNFGVIIMNILSSTQPKQHVKLYHFIKILAKRLNEEEVVSKLDSLYRGVNVIGANRKTYKIPLSVLQYVYDRDSMLGYSPTKTYQKRQITLAGILIALDGVMETLIDYYMQIIDVHNIPLEAPSQPPNFSGVNVDDLPSME